MHFILLWSVVPKSVLNCPRQLYHRQRDAIHFEPCLYLSLSHTHTHTQSLVLHPLSIHPILSNRSVYFIPQCVCVCVCVPASVPTPWSSEGSGLQDGTLGPCSARHFLPTATRIALLFSNQCHCVSNANC